MDDDYGLEIEAIYRMVALACAALTCEKSRDHLAVIAIADSYLEYVDPLIGNLADSDGAKFTLDKTILPKPGK